jgi:hypothetical protein
VAIAALDVNRAYSLAAALGQMSDDDIRIFQRMKNRFLQTDGEMGRIKALADRYDNLYYPNGFTVGGASHWADHPSASIPGRAHVSVNSYTGYVDIGASLLSEPPIENFVADDSDAARQQASLAERVYRSWLEDEKVEPKVHRACVVRGIYGRTAGKVHYDDEYNRPCLTIVEQPRNLRLGWKTSDYSKVAWAIYSYRITAETAEEEWGVYVEASRDTVTGDFYPYVLTDTADTQSGRAWLASPNEMSLEVYDYWYRAAKDGESHELGEPVEYETWNCIFIGNALVKRKRHPEYKGRLPYVPLFNTYIPGVPDGRSEFYDIEQLIREKDERMSEAAQMMSRAINGQMWQLVGPEAPDVVPATATPLPNRVIGPGAGNRVEKVEPWMPEFQVEQHLSRIDRDLADVSGQSDLIRGLAPAAVLSSAKAISALVANYETRNKMKRDLLYEWRREVVDLAFTVWVEKNSALKPILQSGFRHEIIAPSLTPRDDMEASAIAANLVQAKLWSQIRGMDRVGVDDPEAEQNLIREERTDATMFPADVQVQAALLATLAQTRQMQMQTQQMDAQQQQAQQGPPGGGPPGGPPPPPGGPPGAAGPPGGLSPQEQMQLQAQAGLMAAGGGQVAPPGMQGPGETPAGGPPPANTPEGAANALPSQMLAQTQIKGGEASNRLLTQQTLQKG